MSAVYVAALIVGLGINGLQFFLSGGHGADGDVQGGGGEGGGDSGHGPGGLGDGDFLHGEGGHALALDGDAGEPGHGDPGHAGEGAGGFLPVVLSIRFWTYGLLAFGLVGTVLSTFDLAGATATLITAMAVGLASGGFASWVFRFLARSSVSSGGESRDLLGQTGTVLVPVEPGRRGKVRVEVNGRTLDYLATTDEGGFAPGDRVLVEGVGDTELRVGRLPPELGK